METSPFTFLPFSRYLLDQASEDDNIIYCFHWSLLIVNRDIKNARTGCISTSWWETRVGWGRFDGVVTKIWSGCPVECSRGGKNRHCVSGIWISMYYTQIFVHLLQQHKCMASVFDCLKSSDFLSLDLSLLWIQALASINYKMSGKSSVSAYKQ